MHTPQPIKSSTHDYSHSYQDNTYLPDADKTETLLTINPLQSLQNPRFKTKHSHSNIGFPATEFRAQGMQPINAISIDTLVTLKDAIRDSLGNVSYKRSYHTGFVNLLPTDLEPTERTLLVFLRGNETLPLLDRFLLTPPVSRKDYMDQQLIDHFVFAGEFAPTLRSLETCPPVQKIGDKTLDALDKLHRLEHDWDDDGALRPAEKAIADAKMFISTHRDTLSLFPAPTTMPLSDGDVALFWRTRLKYCEIAFSGDGKMYYYLDRDDTSALSGELSILSQNLASSMLSQEWLRKLKSI